MDIQRVVFEHAMLGATSWVAASVYGGAPAHGGVASTIYRAFLSPAHVGSATAGTSALADTVFAMKVYSEPFRVLGGIARVIARVTLVPSLYITAASLPRQNVTNPQLGVVTTRGTTGSWSQ